MSYKTKHNVSWHNNNGNNSPVSEQEIADDLAEIAPERDRGEWLDIITGQEQAEWPETSTHMREVSTRRPGVAFTVNGRGEDQDDTWREYFLDGKSQLVHMPEFDPKQIS